MSKRRGIFLAACGCEWVETATERCEARLCNLHGAAADLLAVCQAHETLDIHRSGCEVCGPDEDDFCLWAFHHFGDLREKRRAAILRAMRTRRQ